MRLLAPILAAAIALSAAPARAGEPSDAEVIRRIDDLQARLDRGTAAADRWWYGWYIGWTTLTSVEATLAIVTTDPGLRKDSAVGAVGCSLGVIPLGFKNFTPRTAAAGLRSLPARTPEERRRKLAAAEELLHKSAEAETFGHSWVPHVMGLTVTTATSLLLGFGYKRPGGALLNALGGVALVEGQIWTQPTRAIDDWNDYVKNGPGLHAGSVARAPSVRWSVTPIGLGLGVTGRF